MVPPGFPTGWAATAMAQGQQHRSHHGQHRHGAVAHAVASHGDGDGHGTSGSAGDARGGARVVPRGWGRWLAGGGGGGGALGDVGWIS